MGIRVIGQKKFEVTETELLQQQFEYSRIARRIQKE